MNARGLLARIVAPLVRAAEGALRPGPYPLPITGGWLPDGAPTNFWQCGIDPVGGFSRSAMVEACISAYSQTVAMCSGDHWRVNDKGGRDRVKNFGAVTHPAPAEFISIEFRLSAERDAPALP